MTPPGSDAAPTASSYSTVEAARLLGISADSVLIQLRKGLLSEIASSTVRGRRVATAEVEERRSELLASLEAVDARSGHLERLLEDRIAARLVAVDRQLSVANRDITDLRARVRELEEYGRGLKRISEDAINLVGVRLVSDSLND